MDALRTDAVQKYPLDMIGDAERVILDAEGSCLEYTPTTNLLEVVLHSRGLRLTGLDKVIVNKSFPGEWNVLYPTYTPDTISSFFSSEYWLELIGDDDVECFMIKGTPTRLRFMPLGRYLVMLRANYGADAWIQLQFGSAVEETGLSYDRAILREQEYIHEYTAGGGAVSAAGLIRHRANLEALRERRLAAAMSWHSRLGERSILRGLGDEFLKDICEGDL